MFSNSACVLLSSFNFKCTNKKSFDSKMKILNGLGFVILWCCYCFCMFVTPAFYCIVKLRTMHSSTICVCTSIRTIHWMAMTMANSDDDLENFYSIEFIVVWIEQKIPMNTFRTVKEREGDTERERVKESFDFNQFISINKRCALIYNWCSLLLLLNISR